jgi:hypothetical protein
VRGSGEVYEKNRSIGVEFKISTGRRPWGRSRRMVRYLGRRRRTPPAIAARPRPRSPKDIGSGVVAVNVAFPALLRMKAPSVVGKLSLLLM